MIDLILAVVAPCWKWIVGALGGLLMLWHIRRQGKTIDRQDAVIKAHEALARVRQQKGVMVLAPERVFLSDQQERTASDKFVEKIG